MRTQNRRPQARVRERRGDSVIEIADADPRWAAEFERLRTRLWPAVEGVAASIEHIGSTSVPGLAAKPILDVTIVVPTEAALPAVIDCLAPLGYRHRGNLGIPGREAFTTPDGPPPHHLYACVAGAAALRNHLAVRDALRGDHAAAEEYAALKRDLAARFPGDIDAYVAGKTPFLLAILRRAGFTAEELDDIDAANRST